MKRAHTFITRGLLVGFVAVAPLDSWAVGRSAGIPAEIGIDEKLGETILLKLGFLDAEGDFLEH